MIGKLNAISVYFAWLFLILLALTFASAMFELHINSEAIGYLFTLFIISALAHFILAYFVRCPHCNKCITIQALNPPHPKSDGSWSKTIIKWFTGNVRCIHCGNNVKTNSI